MPYHLYSIFFIFFCIVLFHRTSLADVKVISGEEDVLHPLFQPRFELVAAGARDVILFGGGLTTAGAPSALVDIYNVTANTHSMSTFGSGVPRCDLAAAGAEDLVLFAGGWDDTATIYNEVDIYDVDLGAWLAPLTLSFPRKGLAGASAGNIAIFGGGLDDGASLSQEIDIYNVSARAWLGTSVFASGIARWHLAAAGCQNLIFFGGGNGGSESKKVDIYDVSKQQWHGTSNWPGAARSRLSAASAGNLVLFGGGTTGGSTKVDTVDIYSVESDSWLATTNFMSGVERSVGSAASIGSFIFFAGGYGPSSNVKNVDIYNVDLRTWYLSTILPSNSPRNMLTAASAPEGNCVLIGGGSGNSNPENTVDRFEITQDVFVSVQGVDSVGCGNETSPCRSISYVLNTYVNFSDWNIILCANVSASSNIFVVESTLMLEQSNLHVFADPLATTEPIVRPGAGFNGPLFAAKGGVRGVQFGKLGGFSVIVEGCTNGTLEIPPTQLTPNVTTLNFENIVFRDNMKRYKTGLVTYGGVMSFREISVNVEFKKCHFLNNSVGTLADSPGSALGGALGFVDMLEETEVRIIDCVFESNSVSLEDNNVGIGGGVVYYGGSIDPRDYLLITGSTFRNNGAKNTLPSNNVMAGGVVYAIEATVTIRECVFNDSYVMTSVSSTEIATSGVLFTQGCFVTLEDVQIFNTRVSGAEEITGGDMRLHQSMFVFNSVSSFGTIVTQHAGSSPLTRGTFLAATAGTGLMMNNSFINVHVENHSYVGDPTHIGAGALFFEGWQTTTFDSGCSFTHFGLPTLGSGALFFCEGVSGKTFLEGVILVYIDDISPYHNNSNIVSAVDCVFDFPCITDGSSTGFLLPNCTGCDAGTYWTRENRFACIDCPPGRYYPGGNETYNTECSWCPAGSVAPTAKTVLCDVCNITFGFASNTDRTDCIQCPAGWYFDNGICSSCPSQYVSPFGSLDLSNCSECPPFQRPATNLSMCLWATSSGTEPGIWLSDNDGSRSIFSRDSLYLTPTSITYTPYDNGDVVSNPLQFEWSLVPPVSSLPFGSSSMTKSGISIEPYGLTAGVTYKFTLRAFQSVSHPDSEISIDVMVSSGSLVACIPGGSSQTVTLPFTLDGSSCSFDEDFAILSANPDLRFSWNESTLPFTYSSSLVLDVGSSDRFVVGNTYTMTLSLWSASGDGRSSNASVNITIVGDADITASINGPSGGIFSGSKLILEGSSTCGGSCEFSWSNTAVMAGGSLIDLSDSSIVPTGTDSHDLVVLPNHLQPGFFYTFELLVATTESSSQSISTIVVEVMTSPSTGNFSCSPKVGGEALNTFFTCKMTNFVSGSHDIDYGFAVLNPREIETGGGERGVYLVRDFASSSSASFILPPGDASSGYLVTIYGFARDVTTKGVTTTQTTVQVNLAPDEVTLVSEGISTLELIAYSGAILETFTLAGTLSATATSLSEQQLKSIFQSLVKSTSTATSILPLQTIVTGIHAVFSTLQTGMNKSGNASSSSYSSSSSPAGTGISPSMETAANVLFTLIRIFENSDNSSSSSSSSISFSTPEEVLVCANSLLGAVFSSNLLNSAYSTQEALQASQANISSSILDSISSLLSWIVEHQGCGEVTKPFTADYLSVKTTKEYAPRIAGSVIEGADGKTWLGMPSKFNESIAKLCLVVGGIGYGDNPFIPQPSSNSSSSAPDDDVDELVTNVGSFTVTTGSNGGGENVQGSYTIVLANKDVVDQQPNKDVSCDGSKNVKNLNCVWYDTVEEVWKGNGCTKNLEKSNSSHTVCDCEHLTSFAGFYNTENVKGNECEGGSKWWVYMLVSFAAFVVFTLLFISLVITILIVISILSAMGIVGGGGGGGILSVFGAGGGALGIKKVKTAGEVVGETADGVEMGVI